LLQLYELPWASLVSHVCVMSQVFGVVKKYEDIDTGKQDVGGTKMLSACNGIPRELDVCFCLSDKKAM